MFELNFNYIMACKIKRGTDLLPDQIQDPFNFSVPVSYSLDLP